MLEELKEQDRSEEEGKAKALEMLKSKFAELAEEVKKLKTTQRQLEQDKDDLERKLRCVACLCACVRVWWVGVRMCVLSRRQTTLSLS